MPKSRTSQRDKDSNKRSTRVSHVCEALDAIAPLHLAQSWDNVGLLAGDALQPVKKILLCIDLTPDVASEAVRKKTEMVMAYHPPIFKPISRITSLSDGAERAVFRCIAAGVAVYSMHTALDAADGGTNHVIAQLCGINETQPLEYADAPTDECKIVVFVPVDEVEQVSKAMFTAGAGRIGDYQKCSFRLEGTGTFCGSDATNPTVGQKGRFETVRETRVEVVCPKRKLPDVISAMTAAHSYEEPAFDVYPLVARPIGGIGRIGELPAPIKLAALARKLKRATTADGVQFVGDAECEIRRAIIVVGAAGSLPFQSSLGPGDVIITGEMRHHDALTTLRRRCCAITLGHWTSERPALRAVASMLEKKLPRIKTILSDTDHEPFTSV